MRFSDPFRAAGRWFKGNTHVHSTASDGKLEVPALAREYKERGFDFLFLTDHWKRTVPPADAPKGILLIPAEEIDFSLGGDGFHVVCLGIRKAWERRTFRSLRQLAALAERDGVSLIMAHPYWLGLSSERLLDAPPFLGIEVYNTVCDYAIGRGYSGAHWDQLLSAGRTVYGFAADDFHGFFHEATAHGLAGGWLMVKSRACTPAAILAAIRHGRFYATQGPEIETMAVRKRRVHVACSPARRINFISNPCRGHVACAAGRTRLREAAWDVPAGSTYVRVECVDADGRVAWSPPAFFD